MTVVTFEDLTKYYGKIRAVEDINLTVQEKEFLALLGPSGCGKTTLLRLVSGLEVPTRGDIKFDGNSILDIPTRERDIAMVFQTWALYTHMTVHDNLAFPLKMRKYSQQKIDSEVKRIADMLDLADVLDRKPNALAGGEQQRVALGRAIIREPEVFLMDEPLSNIDPKLRTQMRSEIKALQKRLGVTTIYVTHDQIEAMTMAHRVVLLDAGKTQQIGTPEEVYDRPSNTFVASFIGSPPMNLINCSFVEEDGRGFLHTAAFKMDVTGLKETIKQREDYDKLIFGVRPEDISISLNSSKEAVKAKVYLTEPLGREVVLDVRLGEEILKVKTTATMKLEVDQDVWLSFDKQNIHIFDRSGEVVV